MGARGSINVFLAPSQSNDRTTSEIFSNIPYDCFWFRPSPKARSKGSSYRATKTAHTTSSTRRAFACLRYKHLVARRRTSFHGVAPPRLLIQHKKPSRVFFVVAFA
jgi:hypothetical protein